MKLARINSLLLVAIILINAYILIMPVLPAVLFWLQRSVSNTEQRLTNSLNFPYSPENHPAGGDSRLVIPTLLMNQPIHEGADLGTLRDGGTWRRPETSTPDKGGNTVIVGHRFTYTNPKGSFYHLDKLRTGDEIGIFWEGQRYIYKVDTIKTVGPTQSEVEAPTRNKRLTLYTCAPLWFPKDRLVVTANLENE